MNLQSVFKRRRGAFNLRFASCVSMAALLAATPGAAFAQEVVAAAEQEAEVSSDSFGEEITVTARRRDETLQQVPVAISAFTADAIENAQIRGLEDVARSSPGMQFSTQGGQTTGRVDSVIRFRGMHVNSVAPSRQVGSLFLDGIYVLGTAHSIPLDDLERVEVIKGPQSSYFGRNTFGGAINYITKTPSLTESSAKISMSAATYDDFEVSGSFELPVIQDVLSVRAGGRYMKKGGMYRATDGGKLGEESSFLGYASLYARPTDRLTIKLRGYYGQDDDGPAAGGFLAGIDNDTCTGQTIKAPTGASVNPRNYICGAVPSAFSGKPVMGVGNVIDGNTSLLPPQAALNGTPNILITDLVQRPVPARIGSVPYLDHMGLRRNLFRVSAAIDYELSDSVIVTAQGALADVDQQNLRDYGPAAFANFYTREARSQRDKSAELRIASQGNSAFSWLIGANYYTQTYVGAANGGDMVALCVDTFNSVTDPVDFKCSGGMYLASHDANDDKIETIGLFGAASYNFGDLFALSLEGRYQIDKNTQGVTRLLSKTYKSFLPRVIAQFTPSRSTNIYASYSIGVLPGAINQRLVDADAQEKAQYEALFAGAAAFTDQEKLYSYEIGWKQTLFGGRGRFAIAGYYADWDNMKSSVSALINETCRARGTGCRPELGEANIGEPARYATGAKFYAGRGLVTAGAAKLYGIEVEAQLSLSREISIGATGAFAGSKYKNYQLVQILPIAGFSDVSGNQLPRFPKWSWSANAAFDTPISDTKSAFGRLDVFYTGRSFADEGNLAYCKGFMTANVRGGIKSGNVRAEVFVRNLTNTDAWATCSRFTDFENPVVFPAITGRQGVVVTPIDKRQIGARFSWDF